MENYTPKIRPNTIHVSYLEGPKVEVKGDIEQDYFIEFIDKKTDKVIYSTTIKTNMWTVCTRKYYTEWVIKVNGEVIDTLNLENQRVLISLESKSLGDTVAWTPYAVEFAKKHNCKVIMSTFYNNWFKGLEAYIRFRL